MIKFCLSYMYTCWSREKSKQKQYQLPQYYMVLQATIYYTDYSYQDRPAHVACRLEKNPNPPRVTQAKLN